MSILIMKVTESSDGHNPTIGQNLGKSIFRYENKIGVA
jgi:hypothetical protein